MNYETRAAEKTWSGTAETGSVAETRVCGTEADRLQDVEAARTTAIGRRAVKEYDVFLCYNSRDRTEAQWVAERLIDRYISPWFDQWEIKPGRVWQRELEAQIPKIPAAAVLLGPSEIGPWQDEELRAFLDEFKCVGRPVIPVILPACECVPEIPIFLKNRHWVDFHQGTPDPLDQLIWALAQN